MKIYDIILYNGEREILEIRLNTLKDVVDYFVLIESPLTFTGLEKPLYYKGEDFKEFSDRIISIVRPKIHNPFLWANEWHSRNIGMSFAMAGVDVKKYPSSDLKQDDVILLSDIDEIPNPEVLREVLKTVDTPVTFKQTYNFYKFNLVCYNHEFWPGTVATKAKYITYPANNNFFTNEFGLQKLREGRATYPKIENGGNHYSYCYSTEEIQRKIKSFCHAPELARFNNPEHINNCIEKGESIWVESDGNRMKKIEMNDLNTPKYILENLDKYKHLIL